MHRLLVIVVALFGLELIAWNLPNWLSNHVLLMGHQSEITGIVAIDKLSMIATASSDSSWRIFTSDGAPVRVISGHSDGITSIASDSACTMVATSSHDGFIRLWSMPRGLELRSIQAHANGVDMISMDANGKVLASVGSDGFVRVWNLDNGSLVTEHPCQPTKCLAIHPLGTSVVHGLSKREIAVWSVPKKRELKRLIGFKNEVSTARFNQEGALLAIGEVDGAVSLWDVSSWTRKHDFVGHTKSVNQIVFGSDSETIWTASSDKSVRCWNIIAGTQTGIINGHPGPVLCVDAHNNGRILSGDARKNAVIWLDPSTFQSLQY